ncbi:MAG: Os1348 family NHLP clan protein [Kineosporiaceae bacterium]
MPIDVQPLTADGKERVENVLRRAADDIDFRERLMANPTEALKDTDLTPDEATVLATMRRVALEEWGVDVRSFRSFVLDNGNKLTDPAVIDPV